MKENKRIWHYQGWRSAAYCRVKSSPSTFHAFHNSCWYGQQPLDVQHHDHWHGNSNGYGLYEVHSQGGNIIITGDLGHQMHKFVAGGFLLFQNNVKSAQTFPSSKIPSSHSTIFCWITKLMGTEIVRFFSELLLTILRRMSSMPNALYAKQTLHIVVEMIYSASFFQDVWYKDCKKWYTGPLVK